MLRRWLPNTLSLARIPASLALIAVYEPSPGIRYWLAVFLIAAIIASDVWDGKLARRNSTQSTAGYIFDGWGDRAFHIAIYLVLFEQGVWGIGAAWILIFREVTVYALRATDPTWHATQTRIERTVTRSYAAALRTAFCLEVLRNGLTVVSWTPAYSKAIAVIVGISAGASYVHLWRRFVTVWRQLSHG